MIDGALVHVDDVDADFRRAKVAGATILSEVESSENGERYRAEDREAHRWLLVERGD